MNEVVILSGARTAIGGFDGALSGFAPCELGAIVARAALEWAGLTGAQIGTVVFGQVVRPEQHS